MLNNHARVDVFDNEGRSALHLAAERGYLKVWKLTTSNNIPTYNILLAIKMFII